MRPPQPTIGCGCRKAGKSVAGPIRKGDFNAGSHILLFLGLTGAAFAESHQDTITSHGISTFGELKYPPDFPHFDYVNPDAPKGGTMSFRGFLASQTFDSLNQFILAGEPAQGLGLIYDSLLERAYDEADAVYGLLAESLEYPEDRSWVVFTLRDHAAFADGEPVTASDVAWTIGTRKTDGRPNYRIALEEVASVEALSEREVRFEFAEGVATRELVPTLRTGDLVVMDNPACHKNPSVLGAIRAVGAHVLFLPPYSSDLNPTKQAFAKIKHRLPNAAARSPGTLWRAVGAVLDARGLKRSGNRHAL